jgi:myo-inositol 2-dehydrogenase / D-chiro-inositol 1-dehydrogenase
MPIQTSDCLKRIRPSRRDFLKLAAGASAFTITHSSTAFRASANSAVSVGIIGCGWRGNHLAKLLKTIEPTGIRVVALADVFDDRLEESRANYTSDQPRIFCGLDAYQKLMATDCDAVLITSPPYFHPEQLEAAVDARKHVYLEKPVAVDAAGAQRVQAAGKKGNGQSTLYVGFQSRSRADLVEATKRVRQGAIGRLVCGNAYYNAGLMGPKDKPGMDDREKRLRNWVFDQVLSGDIIVEQNIHVLDICNWVVGTHPQKAFATGGRKVRTSVGNTWDHFEVTLWYPDDVNLVFASTQFLNLGWGDAQQRFYGSKGAFEALAGDTLKGAATIRGENPWTFKEEMENPELVRLRGFLESIRKGSSTNEISIGVESTLTGILARTAAYRGIAYTWDQMLAENEKLDAGLLT